MTVHSRAPNTSLSIQLRLRKALDRTFPATGLAGTLPTGCLQTPDPTDTGPAPRVDAPAVTALHQNVPNPSNPATAIRFDLARAGRVLLRIYDVAGRLVRTLVDQELPAGQEQSVIWNGLDD